MSKTTVSLTNTELSDILEALQTRRRDRQEVIDEIMLKEHGQASLSIDRLKHINARLEALTVKLCKARERR